jgi:hypothetical protein
METQNQTQHQSRFPDRNQPPEYTALVRLNEEAILVRETFPSHPFMPYVLLVTADKDPELFEQLKGECQLDIVDELRRNIPEPFYQTALFRLGSLRGTSTNLTEALFEIFEYLPDDFAGRERRRFKEILKKVVAVILEGERNGRK